MVEEAAGLLVQRGDGGQVLGVQLEVEDREVLGHTLPADRLGDRHDAPLDQPAQDDLGDALAVLAPDRLQHFVLEQAVLALREGAPGFGLDLVFSEQGLRLGLLMKGVDLDLVDRRSDLVVEHEVHDAVRIEVADAEGTDAAGAVQLLHRPPGAVDVSVGLVDQVEVQIVELQLVHRALERGLCALIAGVLHPELGGNEDLAPVDPAVPDRRADRLLVAIGRGGVEQAVADVESVADAPLAFGRVGNLEDPETQDRHLDTVVQRDGRIGAGHRSFPSLVDRTGAKGGRRPSWRLLKRAGALSVLAGTPRARGRCDAKL